MKRTSFVFLLILISIVSYSKPKPILKAIAKKLNSFQTYQSDINFTSYVSYGGFGTHTMEAMIVTQKVPADSLCGFYYNFETAQNFR